MDDMNAGIDVERFEQSKDRRLLGFLERMRGLFDATGQRYAAFGSCSVFAHLGRLRRLTRDLDVIVPQGELTHLVAGARAHGLEAQLEREHFARIKSDIFQVHAVPETYLLFDYRSRETIARIDTGIDWPEVETRTLVFPTQAAGLPLRVAPRETVLSICLLRPLNANSIADVTGLLASPALAAAGVERFLDRNRVLAPLIASQLDRLAALLEPLGASAEAAAGLDRVRAAMAKPER